MYFKTSDKIILKIKEEINKKGFFAFDVLENNFLSPDLKIYLKFKIVKNLNISNEKFLIFTLISFLIIAFICFLFLIF